MALSHIHESELANRYLAGTLSEAERARYEPEVAQNPDTLRELEATARLKVGLARLRERGELDELLQPAPWARFRPALAVAALLAVVAIGVALVRFEGGSQTASPLLAATAASLVDRQGAVLPVTRTLAVFRKRVAGADATLEAVAVPQAVELRVLPEMTVPSGDYRVALSLVTADRASEAVASIAGLRPGSDGFVSVFVDTSRLSAGFYQLDVQGTASGGSTVAAGTFRIQVRQSQDSRQKLD
jgi:hypothetical protein